MNQIIDRCLALKILQMIESDLLTYNFYIPWCDKQITEIDDPPMWILELTATKNKEMAISAIRANIFNTPITECDWSLLSDFYIACLFYRYYRNEISWATFLLESGRYSDGRGSVREECEYFYMMLNEIEDMNYSKTIENQQVLEVQILFSDVLSIVKDMMNCFNSLKMSNKDFQNKRG